MHYRLLNKICAITCLFMTMTLSQAATVSFNNSVSDINQGSVFFLTVQGVGFPDISGGGLNFSFDSSVLQISSVTINESVFDFVPSTGELDNLAGSLINTSFNTFAGTNSSFDILTIEFEAIGLGSSSLLMSESSMFPFADAIGNTIGSTITYEAATVNVSAVPLPATLWLFSSGLIALIGFVRNNTA